MNQSRQDAIDPCPGCTDTRRRPSSPSGAGIGGEAECGWSPTETCRSLLGHRVGSASAPSTCWRTTARAEQGPVCAEVLRRDAPCRRVASRVDVELLHEPRSQAHPDARGRQAEELRALRRGVGGEHHEALHHCDVRSPDVGPRVEPYGLAQARDLDSRSGRWRRELRRRREARHSARRRQDRRVGQRSLASRGSGAAGEEGQPGERGPGARRPHHVCPWQPRWCSINGVPRLRCECHSEGTSRGARTSATRRAACPGRTKGRPEERP